LSAAGAGLPVRRAIDIAVQIARGLTAAHGKGLVHRDLKPENVFVLADGQVKILDFGLARQTTVAAATAVTGVPTAVGLTDPGMVVGTAGYMAPEQVRGGEVDHRTDIFAFGAMLYEMLSGRHAFQRDTAAETMTAILKEDPSELAESGIQISSSIDRLVRRCLEKQPQLRFQSTADLGFALEAAMTPSTVTAAVPPVASVAAVRRSKPVWIAPATFVLGFAVALALVAWFSGPARPDPSTFRFTPFSFESGGQASPVWSQDGKAVAYAASTDPLAAVQVFVRYLDAAAGKQLTHFNEGTIPVGWTADSRRIVFVSGHQPAGLWSVAVVGGEPDSVMAVDPATNFLQTIDLAADFSAAAFLREDNGRAGVWISSPVGAPPRKYTPEPFASLA
jgi:eukaryotic-like serine/threonine-protein kinase